MHKRLMVNKHVFKAAQVAEILRVMSTHKCVMSIDSWRGRKTVTTLIFIDTCKPFHNNFFKLFYFLYNFLCCLL